MSEEVPPTAPAGAVPAPPKKFACMSCRTRKLRCDSERPTCGNCSKSRSGPCEYVPPSRRRVTKRRNLSALEARLMSLEGKLSQLAEENEADSEPEVTASTAEMPNAGLGGYLRYKKTLQNGVNEQAQSSATSSSNHDTPMLTDGRSPELEEVYPDPKCISELNNKFFEAIYPTVPVLHKQTYLKAFASNSSNSHHPLHLRYAVWALASTVSENYKFLEQELYARSRRHAQEYEMNETGSSWVELDQVRFWVIICEYECRKGMWNRVWASLGRAIRLAQLMGLDCLDDTDGPPENPNLRDFTEIESGRRLFWYSFCMDRYSSVITGRPLTINEDDILTNLPASEQSFQLCIPQVTPSFSQARSLETSVSITAYGAFVITAAAFGDLSSHMRKRDSLQDQSDVVNGAFWKRHWDIDARLTKLGIILPVLLRSGAEANPGNCLGVDVSTQAIAIGLYKTAAVKVKKVGLELSISQQCAARCQNAADEVVKAVKAADFDSINSWPTFTNFCMHMAVDSLAQGLDSPYTEYQSRQGLEILLAIFRQVRHIDLFLRSLIASINKALNRNLIESHAPDESIPHIDKFGAGIKTTRGLAPNDKECSQDPPRASGILRMHYFNHDKVRQQFSQEFRVPAPSMTQYDLNIDAFDGTGILFDNSVLNFDFDLAVQEMQGFEPDDPPSFSIT